MNITVTPHGAAEHAAAKHVPALVEERFASRLFAQDATLWGPAAESEASIRLSWVSLAESSRPLLAEIDEISAELKGRGVDHVALCGMGGSSLAPEVICRTAGVDLTVVDSSQPDMVRAALQDRIESLAVVVSSKSGSTVETDSQRRAFIAAFEEAGIDPRERVVVVTDPGSPFDEQSRQDGYRVVNADPNVGGRFSALTAFGLVPSGLAGADVERLLDEAAEAARVLSQDDASNPGLVLGAAMAGTEPLRDKLVLADAGSGITGLGDWIEQLVAESTGKDGKGVLPVVVEGVDARFVREAGADVTVALLTDGGSSAATAEDSLVEVTGTLGGQMLLWEVATSAAGRLLGINPFDQPNVESAKKEARALMEAPTAQADEPDAVDGAVEIRFEGPLAGAQVASVDEAVAALLTALDPERGYLAVQVYLDRWADAELASVRPALEARTGRPVTFGWGPRFLHSTGQLHKGGPREGVFLQVTTEPQEDLTVAGKEFSFGSLIAAQAKGDATVLAEQSLPVLRLHLTEHDAGLAQLRRALTADGRG